MKNSQKQNENNGPKKSNPDRPMPDKEPRDDGSPSFNDLQPCFDEQLQRIEAIVNRPEAQPPSIAFANIRSPHRRSIRRWCLFAVLFLAASVYWGIDLWRHDFDIYYNTYKLFLEGLFIFLFAKSVETIIYIYRHNPAKANPLRMALYKNPQQRLFNLKRIAYVGVATSFMVFFFSNASIVGDGYTMTQASDNRIETIHDIQFTLSKMNKK